MKTRSAILGVVLIASLPGCLSSGPAPESELTSVSAAVRSTPRYQQAKQFDAFLRKELAPEEAAQLVRDCKAEPSANPFCFSVLKERSLRQFLVREEKAAETVFRQKPEPIAPELQKGRVKNWGQMQKANLRALLSGMREYSLEDLKAIGNFALKRGECPNHIGVATAALLELHLPFENVTNQIAKLYEKGARCTRRKSANHEHYLTRGALFLFLDRKYAAAEKMLMKVQPSDAYSGRALYWLYRVRLAMGQRERAQQALHRLKTQLPLSFHALMVLASEKAEPALPAHTQALPTRSANHQTNQLIEQAETLHEMGFGESATQIVVWTLTSFSPSEPGVRAYLSTLGNPPTQIRTLQTLLLTRPALRNQLYFQLAYPKTYLDLFEEFSSKVDPYLLMAVARKESTLDTRAVSPANAQGLLQIHPDTAKRLSGREVNLFDPRVNAELAARYLAELRDAMKGQLPLMIASYNAGENTVAAWTQRYPTTDMLLFIDLIPYRETRDYVGFVLANYFWYRRLYGENAQQALASLTSGELAKVDEPRGIRSIKSIVDEALRTSESWPEEPSPSPFIHRWKELQSTDEPF